MATAVQVQFRRGTQSQIAAFTGAAGEMVVDTTNNRVVVQDGATAGGWPAARIADIAGGGVNKFRNPGMDIWQRGYGPIPVTTSGGYTADGWIVLPSGASVSVEQDNANGAPYGGSSLKIVGASGCTDVIVKQRIESAVAAQLDPLLPITVQAQIYNNTGATITPKLTVKYPTAADNYTSTTVDSVVNGVSLQSCPNGAFTLVAYTFTPSSGTTLGIEVAFDFGNNLGSPSNSVKITAADIRNTVGATAGLASTNVPPPELRSVGIEMANCLRYLFRVNFSRGSSVNVFPGMLMASSASGAEGKVLSFAVPQRSSAPVVAVSAASDIALADSSMTFHAVTGGVGALVADPFGVYTNGPLTIGSAALTAETQLCWSATCRLAGFRQARSSDSVYGIVTGGTAPGSSISITD